MSKFFKFSSREFSSVFRKDIWGNNNVVKSPCHDIVLPKLRIDEYMWRNLDRWHNKTAIVCGITNRSYTYNELHKQSKILAASLRKKFRISDGDTVGVMMRNCPEYPAVIFGISAAGGVATTFNPIYTAYELERLITLSKAKLLIADPDVIPTIRAALEMCKKEVPIIAADIASNRPENTVSYKEIVEDKHIELDILKEVKRKFDDVSFLPYSSGTTGLPKGVELTHYNLVSNCEQQNTELRQYRYTSDTHQDTTLAVIPMFHSYGFGILMLHKLSVGLKLVTLPSFHPESFLNTFKNQQFDLLYLAPPLVLFLGTNPLVKKNHFERLRLVTSGGAPLAPTDIERLKDKVERDIVLIQAYGMTEASPLVCVNTAEQKSNESAGFAVPNIELRIVDDNLNNLGPDQVGEILVKGPNVMKGYKNNPKANSEVFLEGGWLRSGDLAKIDPVGQITIADRLKELIKVNAYQVPPAELEYVIKEHPAIFDAGVVGIPDDVTGERPKAFVVLKPGVNTTEQDVIEFVKQRVAHYKRVKEVKFIESLPKNLTGKILRKVLREKYC